MCRTFTLILTNYYYRHYHYYTTCRPNVRLLLWHLMFYLFLFHVVFCTLHFCICAVRPAARHTTRTESSKTIINSSSYYMARGNDGRVTRGVAAHSLIDIYTFEMCASKLLGAQCTMGNNTSQYTRNFRDLLRLQSPSFSIYCLFFRLFC